MENHRPGSLFMKYKIVILKNTTEIIQKILNFLTRNFTNSIINVDANVDTLKEITKTL